MLRVKLARTLRPSLPSRLLVVISSYATAFTLSMALTPDAAAQSCGEIGGTYCSQTGSCPGGFGSLGGTFDCSPCCVELESCGAIGGDYCSQTGSCPSGFTSLGASNDCSPCCKNDPKPSCGAMGGDYCSQTGSCPSGFDSLGKSSDCSPCCKVDPKPSCGAMGGDYCSQTGSCPSGFDSLGKSSDCSPCCKVDPQPSCGAMGGDYCSQTGSCPSGFTSLGGSWDCSPCCKSVPQPTCGAMGGDYCSQTGSCPSGFTSLGDSSDCDPCCKAAPTEQTGCPNPNGICEEDLGETLELCRRDCRDRCDVEECRENGDRRRCPSLCRPMDQAYLVSSNFPSCLRPGQSFVVAITMRNRGDTPWSAEDGIKLSAVGDEDPFTSEIRVEIPPGVVVRPRGGIHTFQFTMTAPTTEDITYLTDWQMVREGEARFGSVAREQVRVASDCGVPAGSITDYTCRVRVHDKNGLPIPTNACCSRPLL